MIHVRLRDYVNHYTKLVETVKALESLGVASLSGVIGVDEGFSCQYCVENSRLMYPLPAEDALDLTLIPVSVAEESADPVPLDDALFQAVDQTRSETPPRRKMRPPSPADMFAAAQAKYDSFAPPAPNLMQADAAAEAADETDYVHDKYLTLIVHPSITGADEEAMVGFTDFLDRVEEQSGALVSNQQILDVTAQMMTAGYIGSLVISKDRDFACPNSQVNLTVNWTALLYCPTYYFRIYGKYPSESAWRLHYQTSHYVRTGSYSFNASAVVPDPPTPGDDFYTFMVVGQSCSSGHEGCSYPTVQSHERNSTTSVTVPQAEIKEIKVSPTNPETTKEVTLEAELENAGGLDHEVEWTITPIGTRTWGRHSILGVPIPYPLPTVEGTGNPYKYTPDAGTHGEKRATVVVTFGEGDNTCQIQDSEDFKLFFDKTGDDDGDSDPNWFDYWGTGRRCASIESERRGIRSVKGRQLLRRVQSQQRSDRAGRRGCPDPLSWRHQRAGRGRSVSGGELWRGQGYRLRH